MSFETFKPWLSLSDQVSLLESRGMIIENKAQAEFYLKQIGYYRLSGYFYPFREPLSKKQRADNFFTGTNFQHIVDLYCFDKQIKMLALEAIEHIEIAIRAQIAYHLGEKDPLAHTCSSYFSSKDFDHQTWLEKYRELEERNAKSNDFVEHHRQKYGQLPIWAACELWDFGATAQLFRGLTPASRDHIATTYHLSGKVLASHLINLNFIRNVAAHHNRLWNRKLINRPSLKDFREPQWHSLDANKVFTAFCLMQYLLTIICPNHDWGRRLQEILSTFPTKNAASDEVNLATFGIETFKEETLDLTRWNLWQSK